MPKFEHFKNVHLKCASHIVSNSLFRLINTPLVTLTYSVTYLHNGF